MLGSKQQTHFWGFPHISNSTPVSELFGKILKALAYLCCPEDTTENIGYRQMEMTGSKAIGGRHTLKGVFWVIVSIVVSLAVGQLM